MKRYLITSRQYYTDTPAVFRSILHERIKATQPHFVLYRDPFEKNPQIFAEHTVETCRQFEGLKAFVHQDPLLAHKLKADGVHLRSTQFERISEAKSLGLEVIVSTHSIDELKEVQKLGADYATFSPIFATPGKGEPKGIEALKEAVESVKIKIFALGGIVTPMHVQQLKEANPFGFASIRYFYEDFITPPTNKLHF
jgi:thiamine-phosphate pyrophosphorylase